jgi:hypothetical protein
MQVQGEFSGCMWNGLEKHENGSALTILGVPTKLNHSGLDLRSSGGAKLDGKGRMLYTVLPADIGLLLSSLDLFSA